MSMAKIRQKISKKMGRKDLWRNLEQKVLLEEVELLENQKAMQQTRRQTRRGIICTRRGSCVNRTTLPLKIASD